MGRCASALLLVLLGAALPARGLGGFGRLGLQFGRVTIVRSEEGVLGRKLAAAVRAVQKRFEKEREKLPIQGGSGGEKVYPLLAATRLIDRTASDLDRRITQLEEPNLDALRAWAELELRRIRREAEAPPPAPELPAGAEAPRPASESPPGAAAPGVEEAARRASLRRLERAPGEHAKGAPRPRPSLAGRGAEGRDARRAPPDGGREAGVPTGLLDRVLAVLNRIVFLSENERLKIDVEVAILPQQRDDLLLFPAPLKLEPAGKRKRPGRLPVRGRFSGLWRGIYLYRLDRSPFPGVACPPGTSAEWETCTLDLMHSDGPIVCHLEPRTDREPGCCIEARGSCER